MELRLFEAPQCPFSERARRVLGHKALPHERIHVRWDQIDRLAELTGFRQIPVLQHGADTVRAGSGAIARYLEEVHPDRPLFPHERRADIARWERESERLLRKSMPILVPLWADTLEASERKPFLERHAEYGAYKTLVRDRLKYWRAVEDEWRRLDDLLAGKDHVLEELTYADFALYGAVYAVAQFHGFEVPQDRLRLASWYERMRTSGQYRDQEIDLGQRQPQQVRWIQDLYSDMHYSEPPAGGDVTRKGEIGSAPGDEAR